MTQIKSVYLDYAATTPLSDSTKEYLISVLDLFGNPSSAHSVGETAKQIISDARQAVGRFINANPKDIYFTSSGSAGNSLAIRGIASENPKENQYAVFCSPTAHKSMLRACESCIHNSVLEVNAIGAIHLPYLDHVLAAHAKLHPALKPLVCIEAANSEIGTINDVTGIGAIVHKHNGILVVDATGYIPSCRVNMKLWENYADILTFSGHKLRALKGVGILWKRKDIRLKPLIYGTQEQGLFAGTENVLGIASLGKAVEGYHYSPITSEHTNYVWHYIKQNIPNTYLAGAPVESGDRLPNNLYICLKGVEGESLMLLLDMHGIQVSTGSACNSKTLSASTALSAIGIRQKDIHSFIRLTFSGNETHDELDYVCDVLKKCVAELRNLNPRPDESEIKL